MASRGVVRQVWNAVHRGPLSLLWRRGAHANADKMADCLPDANGGGLEPGPCGAGGRGAQLECAAWARHLSLRAGRASWQFLARTPIDQREEIPLELHPQLRLEVHHWGGAETEDRSAHGEISKETLQVNFRASQRIERRYSGTRQLMGKRLRGRFRSKPLSGRHRHPAGGRNVIGERW